MNSSSPKWVKDSQVNQCYTCDQSFTMLLRRHHCRQCGKIFCHWCSNNYIEKIPTIPSIFSSFYGYGSKIRVCDACNTIHKREKDSI